MKAGKYLMYDAEIREASYMLAEVKSAKALGDEEKAREVGIELYAKACEIAKDYLVESSKVMEDIEKTLKGYKAYSGMF